MANYPFSGFISKHPIIKTLCRDFWCIALVSPSAILHKICIKPISEMTTSLHASIAAAIPSIILLSDVLDTFEMTLNEILLSYRSCTIISMPKKASNSAETTETVSKKSLKAMDLPAAAVLVTLLDL